MIFLENIITMLFKKEVVISRQISINDIHLEKAHEKAIPNVRAILSIQPQMIFYFYLDLNLIVNLL